MLLGIDREQLRFIEAGLRILLPSSKTDQAGKGVELGLSRGQRRGTCPVRALEAWLEVSNSKFGPVFRKVDRRATSSMPDSAATRCAISC